MIRVLNTKHGPVFMSGFHPFTVDNCSQCPFGGIGHGAMGESCRLKEYLGEGSWVTKRDRVPDYCPAIYFEEMSVQIHDSARVPALEANMDRYMESDEYKEAVAKKKAEARAAMIIPNCPASARGYQNEADCMGCEHVHALKQPCLWPKKEL